MPEVPTAPPAHGCGERLLLIEDSAESRALTVRVLSAAGYVVHAASTAAESRALFAQEQGQFDLVFSDVVLPDQNGVTNIEQLLLQKPDLAVLLCSGYCDERSRWPAIEQQRYRFLQKPYSSTTLLAAVRNLLDARPVGA